jgi:hypothetical protein
LRCTIFGSSCKLEPAKRFNPGKISFHIFLKVISVAKQLRLIAAGDKTLTELIGRPELFEEELFNMPNIYFSCDDTIQMSTNASPASGG